MYLWLLVLPNGVLRFGLYDKDYSVYLLESPDLGLSSYRLTACAMQAGEGQGVLYFSCLAVFIWSAHMTVLIHVLGDSISYHNRTDLAIFNDALAATLDARAFMVVLKDDG